jgi:hypothetical protein
MTEVYQMFQDFKEFLFLATGPLLIACAMRPKPQKTREYKKYDKDGNEVGKTEEFTFFTRYTNK